MERRDVMEQPIDIFAEYILYQAFYLHTTDIHFVPTRDSSTIFFRIDANLIPFKSIPNHVCHKMISHFKYLASMDIGEKRKPQSGSLTFQVKDIELYLRISTLPSINDETLVIRIHPQVMSPQLTQLALFPQIANKITSVLQQSHGLYLISGPTGSGKTTTLYSLLNSKELQHKRIITLEDPVERQYDHMIQVQVNELAGITFENGLKAILRHDPDIILVGEIRDLPTAKIAVQAALTGHLVFGTVHASDTIQTVYRFVDLGITSFELQQVLGGVLSQRLVNTQCPYCSGECHMYCPNRKRLAIFELLYGVNLQKVFSKEIHMIQNQTTILDNVKKGYVLGYLSQSHFTGIV